MATPSTCSAPTASTASTAANAESTPFGHGRPYSRRQLGELMREAELEPSGWTRALYVPPAPWVAGWAEGFEQVLDLVEAACRGLLQDVRKLISS